MANMLTEAGKGRETWMLAGIIVTNLAGNRISAAASAPTTSAAKPGLASATPDSTFGGGGRGCFGGVCFLVRQSSARAQGGGRGTQGAVVTSEV